MDFLLQQTPLSRLRKLSRTFRSLPGLTVYYPMNELTGTSSVNNAPATLGTLNGTISNTLVGQPGNMGKAYYFDGAGDRVIVTGLVPADTFSFAILYKRDGNPDANDRILDQASGGPTRGWHLGIDANGNVGLRTWNNGGASLSLDFGIIADGEWAVLSGSIGASSSEIYLNGVEIDSGGGNSFGSGVIADLQLGARSGGTSNAFKGFLQHFALASGVKWTPEVHAKFSAFFLI